MASRGVNRVTLVGTMGNDPDVRYLPNGNPVVNISLATSETWTDKATGTKQEKTEWHRVAIFGKPAEIVGEFAKKGNQIYVEGKLQTREWEKDGIKRHTTEIVVDQNGTVQLLGSRSSSGGSDAPRSQGSRSQPSPAPAPSSRPANGNAPPRQSAAPAQRPAPSDDLPDYDSFDDDFPI